MRVSAGLFVGALAAGALTVAGTVSSAEPQPFAVDADAARVMELQEPLVAAANELKLTIDRMPNGYAGMRLEPESGELTLWWRGSVPAVVEHKANALSRPGRTVRLMTAPHTYDELKKEAVRLAQANPSVASVEVQPDGSGLNVVVDQKAGQPVGQLTSSVTTSVTTGDRPLVVSRWADTSPFWGGAMMQSNARGNRCSSGFAATRNGRAGIITAHHCGAGDWSTPTNTVSSPRAIGRSVATVPDYDMRFIETANSAGRIYDGGADRSGNGSGEFSKAVAGVSTSQAGVHVCTSGGYSGARCNIRIVSTFVVIQPVDGNGNVIGTYISARADHVNGQNAAGQGDSGGPVFTLTGDRVNAEGIISAINAHFVPCTGIVSDDYGTRQCGDQMYYAYVAASGWTVRTSS